MDKLQQFYDTVRHGMTAILATAESGSVTMRTVSPVLYEGGVLIFTSAASNKYRQLKAEPSCCMAAGAFFMEAEARFLGPTMLPENAAPRAAYSQKFPGAFDEGLEFGGRNAEFILLKPLRLTGWAFENDIPNESGIPTIPFELLVD